MHSETQADELAPPTITIPAETTSAIGALFFYPDPGTLAEEGFTDPALSPVEADSSARRIGRVLDIMGLSERGPQ